ncbi:hypothetical protein PG990_008897 [Apiospora arundinis]
MEVSPRDPICDYEGQKLNIAPVGNEMATRAKATSWTAYQHVDNPGEDLVMLAWERTSDLLEQLVFDQNTDKGGCALRKSS